MNPITIVQLNHVDFFRHLQTWDILSRCCMTVLIIQLAVVVTRLQVSAERAVTGESADVSLHGAMRTAVNHFRRQEHLTALLKELEIARNEAFHTCPQGPTWENGDPPWSDGQRFAIQEGKKLKSDVVKNFLNADVAVQLKAYNDYLTSAVLTLIHKIRNKKSEIAHVMFTEAEMDLINQISPLGKKPSEIEFQLTDNLMKLPVLSQMFRNIAHTTEFKHSLQMQGAYALYRALALWYLRSEVLAELFRTTESFFGSQYHNLQIAVLPTGSEKITSDKDVQVAVIICYGNYEPPWNLNDQQRFTWNRDMIKNLAHTFLALRVFTDDKLQIAGLRPHDLLEHTYDVNFYPPTLFARVGFMDIEKCLQQYYAAFYYVGEPFHDKKGNVVMDIVWRPQLGDDKVDVEVMKRDGVKWDTDTDYISLTQYFIRQELRRAVLCTTITWTEEYLNNYAETVATALQSLLLHALQAQEKGEEPTTQIRQYWNEHLLDTTAAAAIGPEMYTTISSIFWVVWYFQGGNKIEHPEDMGIFAIVVTIENWIHFWHTKKKKYLQRACLAFKGRLSVYPHHMGLMEEEMAWVSSYIEENDRPSSPTRVKHDLKYDKYGKSLLKGGFREFESLLNEHCETFWGTAEPSTQDCLDCGTIGFLDESPMEVSVVDEGA